MLAIQNTHQDRRSGTNLAVLGSRKSFSQLYSKNNLAQQNRTSSSHSPNPLEMEMNKNIDRFTKPKITSKRISVNAMSFMGMSNIPDLGVNDNPNTGPSKRLVQDMHEIRMGV